MTTDNIEETKQNLTKLVQETYVKDESEENKNKDASDAKTKVKCKYRRLEHPSGIKNYSSYESFFTRKFPCKREFYRANIFAYSS